MDPVKQFKKMQRALARYGLYAFFWLFQRIPYRFVRVLGAVFLRIGFFFVVGQKRIARESLRTAFGDGMSAGDREAIVKRCFMGMGWGMVEMLYALAHPSTVHEKVRVSGRERLDAALARGKGVVAVTAHFGNFPLMMLAFAQKGYPTSAVIRPARDKDLEEFLLKKRSDVGVRTVYALPRNVCVVQSLQVLRENGVLFLALDQNFGAGSGVFVDFFGRKAATATGPAVFAMRSDAVILPMFMVRVGPDRHDIVIEEPIAVGPGQDDDEKIYQTTAALTRVIERYIRRYPHEWGWMHRRWKTEE